jgi:hypothetical protein
MRDSHANANDAFIHWSCAPYMTTKPVPAPATPPGKISRKLWEDAEHYLKAADALIQNAPDLNLMPTYHC